MKQEILDPSKIKILICCHKHCSLPKDDIFLPIQVGSAISNIDLGIQRDDNINGLPCDNISEKNKSYCELTAIYWAWKNIKKLYPDLKYIGVNHYRRFFYFDKKTLFKDIFIRSEDEVVKYTLKHKFIKKYLDSSKIIVAKKKIYPYSLMIDYSVCHLSEDIRTLNNVIKDLYPEYVDSFNEILMKNNKLAHYNMTIIGWEDFCAYCEWLFSILKECENRINIDSYNDVQKRIFGYMGERLFNIWLYKNKKKIVEIPIVQYVNNIKELPGLFYFYKTIRYNLSMGILTPWRTNK